MQLYADFAEPLELLEIILLIVRRARPAPLATL